jgi:hypothetical protein
MSNINIDIFFNLLDSLNYQEIFKLCRSNKEYQSICNKYHTQIVQKLLKKKNYKKFINQKFLEDIVDQNNIELTKKNLYWGADIHVDKDQAFLYACMYDDINLVKFLLENGKFKFNSIKDQFGNPILISLIKLNYINLIKLLLDYGVDVNIEYNNKTPIVLAVDYNNYDIIKLLIKYGADIHYNNGLAFNNAMTFRTFTQNFKINVIELFLEYGINNNILNNNFVKSIEIHLNYDLVKLFLEYGANVHYNNDFALKKAIDYKYKHIIKLLLEYGANINVIDHQIIKELYLNDNYHYLINLFINYNLDVHLDNDWLLREASETHDNYDNIKEFNNKIIVNNLLKHGADVHVNDDEPLREACKLYSNYDIILLLLKNGADIHSNNDEPIRNVFNTEYVNDIDYNIVKLLTDYGANIHVNDDEVIKKALESGNEEIYNFLLNYDKNKNGQENGN